MDLRSNYRLLEMHKRQQDIHQQDHHVPAGRMGGHERQSIHWQFLADCVGMQWRLCKNAHYG